MGIQEWGVRRNGCVIDKATMMHLFRNKPLIAVEMGL
jgi:hypothetical protein